MTNNDNKSRTRNCRVLGEKLATIATFHEVTKKKNENNDDDNNNNSSSDTKVPGVGREVCHNIRIHACIIVCVTS